VFDFRSTLTLVCVLAVAGCAPDVEPDDADTPLPNPLLQPADFTETAPERFRAEFETTAGIFRIEVHRAWAPLGADRFYNLVQAGFYDGIPFHRVLEGFVADFGIHPDPWVNAAWRQALLRDDPVVESNLRGRISFSKGGPNRRTVQVFVNLRDNPELDADGFAPFGEVVAGLDTVEALYAAYGDGPPRGDGVYQAMAIARGDEYFAEFPELDRILTARLVE
jgi:peptidyl-prolyl cis-trans isomerase A (cyclophilin A)